MDRRDDSDGAHHHYAGGGSSRSRAPPRARRRRRGSRRTSRKLRRRSHSFKRPPSSARVLGLPSYPRVFGAHPSEERTQMPPGSPFQTRITGAAGDGRRRQRREDADKVPQDAMRRMVATGIKTANNGATLGVSTSSSRGTAPASVFIGLRRFGAASVVTAPLLFFHLQRFHGDTGPRWQNKAFYCWFGMKYSCKCTKY